jgi:hypothetical protein
MMIPTYWSEPAKIHNLDQILESYRNHGGAIVEYRRIWSVLTVAISSPRIEWVPKGASRAGRGLRHALFCALLGWWSLPGFFGTIGALVQNLRGGIDVTAVLAPSPGQPADVGAVAQMERARRVQGIICALILFALLAALLVFVVYPALREEGWL